MSHSFKICLSGTSIVCLLLSGCAGGGLKNMFSRDDTAGYQTLEEIEAKEAGKPSEKSAVAASDSEEAQPRFASWLPFGKKDEAASKDLLAEAEKTPDAEKESSTYGKWWQRPFKTRDPYESDPFLADSNETSTADKSKSETDPAELRKSSTRTVASSSEKDSASKTVAGKLNTGSREVAESGKKDLNVRPVSATRTTDDEAQPADDERLAEKFEEQFRKNTLQAAEQADEAEPLIVAGKSTAEATAKEAKSRVQKTSDEKLGELEQLLTERKTAAVKKAREQKSKAQDKAAAEASRADTAADELFAAASDAESATKQKSAAAKKSVDSKLSNFDLLLMEANGDLPANESVRTTTAASKTSSKTTTTKPRTIARDDVRVASAEDLFGTETEPAASTKARKSMKPKSSTTNKESGDGFEWQQSQFDDSAPPQDEASQSVARSSFKEETRPRSQTSDQTGTAIASDAVRHVTRTDRGAKSSPQADSPFRTVSAPRAVDEDHSVEHSMTNATDESSSSFAGDGFFTQAPLQIPIVHDKPTAPAEVTKKESPVVATTGTGAFQMSRRHWMLLIGGLIVVALLFAPGGKKHLSAGPGPVQG